MKSNKARLWRLVFLIYIAFLIIVVAIKFTGSFDLLEAKISSVRANREMGYWNYNLEPFNSLAVQWKYIDHGWAKMNLLANLLAFVPFGFLLPIAFPRLRGFFKVFALSILLVLAIEGLQFFSLLGSFDVDDIMLNLPGCMLGYVVYLCGPGRRRRSKVV